MIEEKNERLGAHEVAAFLRRHPKFLGQFPDLAVSLLVPKEEGQAASLASYQLDVLRDKNRELTRRLNELFANAQENERLAVRTHQLSLALMRARGKAETLRTMVAVLGEDFRGEDVRVVLFEAVDGLQADWLQVIPEKDAALKPFRDFLASDEPLTGRLNQDKLALLFGDDQARAASAVLLALPGFGLLAVGSSDPNRFFPGMGTLFLRLMAESLVTALGRPPAD
ncbi:hypothetical protein GCM10011521_16670 [Arenimonas soli]|uniref:DUF484 domain-containing protein n=1 Tax=Arenimonas soli TaxID=2269504 RepID=A0ABQ1HJE3_9GAMM|nr:hypothetical protein GCM10011521_16670 [Arenimonas soli]